MDVPQPNRATAVLPRRGRTVQRSIVTAALAGTLVAGPGSAETHSSPALAAAEVASEAGGEAGVDLSPAGAGASEAARPRARPRLSDRERTLLERPDRKRLDEGPTLPLFGRPLVFGGQYELRTRYEDDRLADDGDKVDYVQLNQSARLDAWYRYGETVSAYVQGRFVNRNLLWATNDDGDSEWNAALGEGWLFLGDLLGTPVSLQVGRQRIFDEREWWWDEEFDAIRLHVDQERLHAEASVAADLAPISTDLEDDDPEDEDIVRAFGRLMYEWAPKQQVAFYGLRQWDRSPPHFVGQVVDGQEEEDESDGDLTWLGVSALGRRPAGALGRVAYWLDAAYVWGSETFYSLSGPNGSRRLRGPQNIDDHSVRGWGVDVGVTWETTLPARPSFTLSYARGSGRPGTRKSSDRGFRQTGLQDDNWKWQGGVNRFKYYGEVLEPELSNLRILSAAVGLRFLRESSVTLAYHHFRQVEAAAYLRDVNTSADPDGLHRSIGQEWNLIVGIEEWRNLELELIGGIFRAGAAFGPVPGGEAGDDRVVTQEGDLSYLGFVQVRLNF